jgi:pantoate--beta-alanine ligase
MVFPESEAAEHFKLGRLESVLEGALRPGHFLGVAQVISKLLAVVRPARMYLGLKDYQQCQVIARAVPQMQGPVPELVFCPTMREADGLAMSSRNVLLSEQERAIAPKLFETLQAVSHLAGQLKPAYLAQWASEELNNVAEMHVDYVQICDAKTLRPATDWNPTAPNVVLAAVRLGKVRLIDNLQLPC